ncbi:MAG: hypothetical protein IKQ90_00240 [Ruminococcus sp.]|nr:hypothetical protein [Ruminococcus sp.]
MIKKIIMILCLAACAASVYIAARSVRKSGMLEKMPDPVYLSDEDAAERPVYKSLLQRERAVYTALYNGVVDMQEDIKLPYDIPGDVYNKLYCIIEKQESGLFYLDSTYFTAAKIEKAHILYREPPEKIAAKVKLLEDAADEMLSGLPDGDDFDKALYIHDMLVENCEYSAEDESLYGSTAYGCIVEKVANCEGYAKAFSYLADKCGIRSVVVTGTTARGENHAWNQACINDNWYDLDVTWDDIDVEGECRRIYFLCTDDDFGRSHFADNKYFQTFECSSTQDTYYVREGLLASNNMEAEQIIQREAVEGNEQIELRFSDEQAYSDFKETYIKNQYIFRIIDDSGFDRDGRRVSVRENEQERCIVIYIK